MESCQRPPEADGNLSTRQRIEISLEPSAGKLAHPSAGWEDPAPRYAERMPEATRTRWSPCTAASHRPTPHGRCLWPALVYPRLSLPHHHPLALVV